jgi:hypothetical protein
MRVPLERQPTEIAPDRGPETGCCRVGIAGVMALFGCAASRGDSLDKLPEATFDVS